MTFVFFIKVAYIVENKPVYKKESKTDSWTKLNEKN